MTKLIERARAFLDVVHTGDRPWADAQVQHWLDLDSPLAKGLKAAHVVGLATNEPTPEELHAAAREAYPEVAAAEDALSRASYKGAVDDIFALIRNAPGGAELLAQVAQKAEERA